MIPYILAAVGGYLIGNNIKASQYTSGGYMEKGGNVDLEFKREMELELEEINEEIKELQESIKADYEDDEITKITRKNEKELELLKERKKNVTNVLQKMADGGKMAKGGIVVTKISDIPNFKQRLKEGKITYRGLGIGKLADDFYKIAGTGGVRIKVDGKEYFITDKEFDTFSRDKNGLMRIRFSAPYRKFSDGGVISYDDWRKMSYEDQVKHIEENGAFYIGGTYYTVLGKDIVELDEQYGRWIAYMPNFSEVEYDDGEYRPYGFGNGSTKEDAIDDVKEFYIDIVVDRYFDKEMQDLVPMKLPIKEYDSLFYVGDFIDVDGDGWVTEEDAKKAIAEYLYENLKPIGPKSK